MMNIIINKLYIVSQPFHKYISIFDNVTSCERLYCSVYTMTFVCILISIFLNTSCLISLPTYLYKFIFSL